MAKSISFSPDGQKIATRDGHVRDIAGSVKIWSNSGRELQTFKSKNIYHLGFNPNGKILVFNNLDDTTSWKSLDLDELMFKGCDWLDNYLQNNPGVSNYQKRLCNFTQNKSSNPRKEQTIDIPVPEKPSLPQQIQLPSDSSDLARNKPVKASGHWRNATPEYAVDNRVDTLWGTSESTGAWIYIDLGKTFEISRVTLSWGWDTRYVKSAESWIEVSNDAQNWRKVADSVITRATIYNSHSLKFPSTQARYVRFYAARWNGGWGTLRTIQVYQD